MKQIEVVAAIIKSDNRYLVAQRGYGEFKGYFEFPGGKIELGETREEALIREIKEELNVVISVENFLCTVEYEYPSFHLIMHCYYSHIIDGEIEICEHQSIMWVEKEKLINIDWIPADVAVMNAILSDQNKNQ
ncbi:MAG: (deoxy)nucleoside triphosphate pyrophosphohydrolase [Erysipelotrichaceae bacterium]